MIQNALITVVIPTKGRTLLLKRAIESVLRQTFTQFDIVVVVDGNDQETVSVLNSYSDERLHFIVNAQSVGGAEARNVGVREAKTDWIAFLDDDDEFLPDKLEKQFIYATQSHAIYPVVFCRVIGRTPRGDYVWPRRKPFVNEHISDYILARNTLVQGEGLIQTTMLMVKKQLLIDVPFRKELKRHQEWDWVLRIGQNKNIELIMCDETLAVWYVEENRKTISSQGDWEFSANWIRECKSLVTPRAYSAFLMTVVSGIASKGQRIAFWRILYDAIRNGKPAPIDYIIFLGIWLLPQRLRRGFRNLKGRDLT